MKVDLNKPPEKLLEHNDFFPPQTQDEYEAEAKSYQNLPRQILREAFLNPVLAVVRHVKAAFVHTEVHLFLDSNKIENIKPNQIIRTLSAIAMHQSRLTQLNSQDKTSLKFQNQLEILRDYLENYPRYNRINQEKNDSILKADQDPYKLLGIYQKQQVQLSGLQGPYAKQATQDLSQKIIDLNERIKDFPRSKARAQMALNVDRELHSRTEGEEVPNKEELIAMAKKNAPKNSRVTYVPPKTS